MQRQEQKIARGKQSAKQENQAAILIGRKKMQSETTIGKLKKLHLKNEMQLDQAVSAALEQIDADKEIMLKFFDTPLPKTKKVIEVINAQLPYGPPHTRHINLNITGPQRIGVYGPNGCGKSTLLKLLAGQLTTGSETNKIDIAVPFAYLDQHTDILDANLTVIDQFLTTNQTIAEGHARTLFSHLDLMPRQVTSLASTLSGGERIKAALCCLLYSQPTIRFLLLDEPTNHVDLDTIKAIEKLLKAYRGAMLVVSHDQYFLDNINLTHRLNWTSNGWKLLNL